MNKMRKFIAFNKLSKAYCGMLDADDNDTLPVSDYYLYREAEVGDNDIWHGNYDMGKVVPADSVPFVVLEESLDQQAMDKIRNSFDYYAQINALIAVLDGLIYGDISEQALADYEQIKAVIKETRVINKRRKQSYKDSDNHEFVSKAQQDAILADQLEGGLHEIIGPRQVGFK